MEELKDVVMSLTDEELQEAAGAGCGWWCTLTDDCPNSVVVCC